MKALQHEKIHVLVVSPEEASDMFWALCAKVRDFEAGSDNKRRYTILANAVGHILWPHIIDPLTDSLPPKSPADHI